MKFINNIFYKTIYLIVFFLEANYIVQAQCPPNGGSQNGLYGTGGNTDPKYTPRNSKEWFTLVVGGGDPNEINGPIGYEIKKWISVNDRAGYSIHFENDPKIATAPAQNVFVSMPVHEKININSLQLAEVGFGKFRFSIPPGSSYYAARLDVKDSMGLFVDLTAGIDIVNNEIFWRFRSIDPDTGLPPADPQQGFLPVNDALKNEEDSIPGKGEGYVSFSLKPLNTVQTGDTATEKASIIFDINEPVLTNIWTNTIDAVAPVSKIKSVEVKKDTVTLKWSGTDDKNGSGVRDYALYYTDNDSVYSLYQDNIADTVIQFVGTPGKSYCFFTLAYDNTGNREVPKYICEASAKIASDGSVLPVKWLYFTGRDRGKDVELNWATTSEINTSHFEIQRSLNGLVFDSIATVRAAGTSSITNNYFYNDLGAMSLPVKILYYRLKQFDKDGKFIYSVTVQIRLVYNNEEPVITAFPNPFSTQITLKIVTVTQSDQTDHVMLYSVDGKLIYSKKIIQRGSATILLDDLPNVPQGIYLLRTSINGKLYTIKMIRN